MTGTWGRELTAGATTFFAMSYIMFVNPTILNKVGMDPSAVFVATCMVSAVVGICCNCSWNADCSCLCDEPKFVYCCIQHELSRTMAVFTFRLRSFIYICVSLFLNQF